MEVAKAGVWSIQRRLMEDLSDGGGVQRRVDAKRPNMGFPFGPILVVLIVLGISALFSCCYHWDKIRTLYAWQTNSNFGDLSIETVHPNLSEAESASRCKNLAGIQHEQGGTLAVMVMMPGEKTPNFIARPSPHQFPPSHRDSSH